MEPTIDSKGMTYDAARRMLTTEVSQHDELRGAGQVPKTVVVRSHRTGRTERFVYRRKVTNAHPGMAEEAETVAWVYYNEAVGVELHIVND